MAISGLTDKQERFAQLVVELSSKSEAYRRVYDCENMTDKSINEEACRTSMNLKVSARIEELRDELAIQSLWRRVNSVNGLKKIAESNEAQHKDIVAAIKALNSMYGWDKQTIDNISSDGSMSPKGKSLDDFYKDSE